MDRLTRAPGYRSICAQCRKRLLPQRSVLRSFSTTTPSPADRPDPPSEAPIDIPDATSDAAASVQQPTDQTASPSTTSTSTPAPDPLIQDDRPQFLESIRASRNNNAFTKPSSSDSNSTLSSLLSSAVNRTTVNSSPSSYNSAYADIPGLPPLPQPHHLHIYATKHNTHITLTAPSRDPIISVSAGTIGFRKAARGTYDAAYQLGAYVMGRIQQQGLLAQIQHLEVVLRDFGPGRDAVSKILLGSEGRNLRGRVVRVSDCTRLKFGGTRSKKPRRLG
ncbi:MAG: hypothetical protein L6R38_007590 [Xanthoria sp. 2 TBL-2021]|nr:MAG: hypothetical protein L6R38_007590 [Xanthoria sp. 2 TBL-2021]